MGGRDFGYTVGMSLFPIQTADGSYTLYQADRDVHFRSVDGARSEAEYVFLEGTRLAESPEDWSVLELGLGPGLNFLVTAQAALKAQKKLFYHVVEYRPLAPEWVDKMSYADWVEDTALLTLLKEALALAATQEHVVLDYSGITLALYACDWRDLKWSQSLNVRAVYHDPFGPKDDPESWQQTCYEWYARHIAQEGILATYGASGALKRALAKSGWYIASRKGAGRKREMTLASRSEAPLTPYKRLSRERYLK